MQKSPKKPVLTNLAWIVPWVIVISTAVVVCIKESKQINEFSAMIIVGFVMISVLVASVSAIILSAAALIRGEPKKLSAWLALVIGLAIFSGAFFMFFFGR